MSYKIRTKFIRIAVYSFLIILLLITLLPIWLLLVNATRTTEQIQQSISFIPGTNLINNIKNLTGKGLNLGQGFANSVFVSFTSTILTVYFSVMTAYALKVYNFKGKKFIRALIIVMVLVPAQLSITGMYQYMAKLDLLNSYIPLIIPAIASAGNVFFAIQYLDASLVPELIEAARVDGCKEFMIFNRIALPLAAPGAFTMAIFAFVASWNSFLIPFTLISSQKKYTLPMVMSLMKGDVYRTDYGGVYLGMAITVIPVIIVYSIFSKYIVNGISMGAVKE